MHLHAPRLKCCKTANKIVNEKFLHLIKGADIKITGTFLDEISHDIPHQNWGKEEWDRDFAAMRAMGIDTVILIRCGYRRWMTWPSKVLSKQEDGYPPPLDLVNLFLLLSEKYNMSFYFGLYDSGRYWNRGEYGKEVDINIQVIDEVWEKYGSRKAFKGWYLSQEVSRKTGYIIDLYARMGRYCKEVSGGLPTLISPYIDGLKNVSSADADLKKSMGVTPEQHEKEWTDILAGIRDAVDIVAFQDGHVDFFELADYLDINKHLAEKYGLRCWSNCESFDRDMPIKFLPIKWEKLLLKLRAAEKAGIKKAITFEFSHFMSPNSCYPQAGHLYNRYCDYFGIKTGE